MADVAYPFTPKSNAKLLPGHVFSIPLSDGRFGAGRVIAIDREASYGARTFVVADILDWVGPRPPTAGELARANASPFDTAHIHVHAIAHNGGAIVSFVPLGVEDLPKPSMVVTYGGDTWPSLVAEARFVLPPPRPRPELREVESPLTDEMLRPFSPAGGTVQFASLLTDDDFERLATLLEQHPDVTLRAYGGYDGSITDLEFLRFFPRLESFGADALFAHLSSLDGLRHLPVSLRELWIGRTKRPLDLAVLERFAHLETLFIEGQRTHIEVLRELRSLEELTLRSITLPDLSLLLPLERLRALDLKLGGTKDLGLLGQIGRLEYIELWMIKALVDISPIAEVHTLRYLFLESLRRVEQLPDLRALTRLRRVELQNMKGLTDLSPLAQAPALRELGLIDMGHLQPDDLACLVGHPTLRAVTPNLGSRSKEAAAADLLGLPDAPGFKPPWRTVADAADAADAAKDRAER